MLKKILACLSCCLALTFLWIASSISLFSRYSSETEVYLEKNNSCAIITKVENNSLPFQFYKYGEACEVDKSQFDLEKTLREFDAKVLWTEDTESGKSYYAYAPKMRYSCQLKGKKINLHLFVGRDKVKMASPLVFGSY